MEFRVRQGFFWGVKTGASYVFCFVPQDVEFLSNYPPFVTKNLDVVLARWEFQRDPQQTTQLVCCASAVVAGFDDGKRTAMRQAPGWACVACVTTGVVCCVCFVGAGCSGGGFQAWHRRPLPPRGWINVLPPLPLEVN